MIESMLFIKDMEKRYELASSLLGESFKFDDGYEGEVEGRVNNVFINDIGVVLVDDENGCYTYLDYLQYNEIIEPIISERLFMLIKKQCCKYYE